MEKLKIKAVFTGARAGKEKIMYGDFQFMGGSFSCALSAERLEEFRRLKGQEITIEVSLKAQGIVQFDRSVTVFVPVDVLSVATSYSGGEPSNKLK